MIDDEFHINLLVGPVTMGNSLALAGAEFHIAPTGNDGNPGSAAQPFRGLTRAREAVRNLKANSGIPDSGITVVVHGGEYVLRETFELTPLDSGAPGRPVRYMAADGETPSLTSSRVIGGWQRLVDSPPAVNETAREHLWYAEVPKGWRFHSLFVDGVAQAVARTPNSDLKEWRLWPHMEGSAQMSPEGLRVRVPGDVLKGLPTSGDVEVNFLAVEWWNTLAVLKGVDGNIALLASRNPNTWVLNGKYVGYNGDGAMSFRNALALLDQPGEWCVDSVIGRVYYWPADGAMEGKTITAPALNELVRLQGDDLAARSNQWRIKFDQSGRRIEASTPTLNDSSAAAFTQVVHNIELVGLTFACTDRLPEDQWPSDWLKRNCENPDAALFLQGVQDCLVANCVFKDCGAYAVVLDHFAQQVALLGNEIARCGSGGVQATGYGPGTLDVNHHHIIRRNHIHDVGCEYMHSAAVTLFGSGQNDISLNWIANCPYAAVQICSANHIILNNPDNHESPNKGGPALDFHGDGTAQFQLRNHELPPPNGRIDPADFESVKRFLHTGGNWIARNIVDEFMTTLGDGAALYSWSVDHNSAWLENLLKRHKRRTPAFVLYTDDWSGRQILQGNLSWASAHGKRGAFWDNSHTPQPSARPITHMSVNTVPIPDASGATLSWWRNNINSFPDKPAGFDERFSVIESDAAAEGGWPGSVTAQIRRAFVQERPQTN